MYVGSDALPRYLSALIDDVFVSAAVDQVAEDLVVVERLRVVEGRVALVVWRIDINMLLKEHLDGVELAGLHGRVQEGVTLFVQRLEVALLLVE